jgi:hypothetical protein
MTENSDGELDKVLSPYDTNFSKFLATKKQQFNTPVFMSVSSSNSVESVELDFLQVGEKLNEQ